MNIYLLNFISSIIDTMDTAFFKICFVQLACAAGSAAIELFICLEVQLQLK